MCDVGEPSSLGNCKGKFWKRKGGKRGKVGKHGKKRKGEESEWV